MLSLTEFRDKQKKDEELFKLQQEYNTIFEYENMVILSIIYGIVETEAIKILYDIITDMLDPKNANSIYNPRYPVDFSKLFTALENVVTYIHGNNMKYKIRVINCDKEWNCYKPIQANFWIRYKRPGIDDFSSVRTGRSGEEINLSLLISKEDKCIYT